MKIKFGVVVLTLVLLTSCGSGSGDTKVKGDYFGTTPNRQSCLDAGGTIYEKFQFGGKYNVATHWCTDSNGRITGLWFKE